MDAFRLYDTRRLVDCAMGRTPADTVIQDGRWVCVQSGEIVPHTDIAIIDGRIAYVGPDASASIGKETEIIAADGAYLVPGLLDGHMHVESGMLTVTEFVRAAAPRGTTGMFIDPHEIANVFGLRGVKLMADEALLQPIHVFVQVPSCVPSAPGFETPGDVIDAAQVAEALEWEGIIGLGEMMNYPGVFLNDEEVHRKMEAARRAEKPIGGHYSSPDLGLPFHGYAAGGAGDDHEGTTVADAIARIRQGMWVMMREGSGWRDVAELVRAVTEERLDPRRFILCTDDSHSHTLVEDGHMDRVVRFAISQGLSPIRAIQMATINTAERFGVETEMGMIAPGRYADILLMDELSKMQPRLVIARGKQIGRDRKWLIDLPEMEYPDWTTHSVNIPNALKPSDFIIPVPEALERVAANVIGVKENQAPTDHLTLVMPVIDGELRADQRNDIAKAAVLERHHASGRIQMGLVRGFHLTERCAIGSTVAHDSHQMVLVGTDDENMAIAANALREMQGGQVVVRDGRVIGLVRLPIAGLMSDQSAEVVATQADSVLTGYRACGCSMSNANMQLSLMALVVIPSLRLSDQGLFDANQFKFIPLYSEGK